MANKNINDFNVFTSINTGDYVLLWDTSAGITYKVYVNDIANLPAVKFNNHFFDILVDRYAWISGVIGGNTGANLLSGQYPGILAGRTNRAVGNDAAVIAGATNLASGARSVVAGDSNSAFGPESAVIGGMSHYVGASDSVIVGGDTNKVLNNADSAAILVGFRNLITGISSYSAIIGGQDNKLMALRSVSLGGKTNMVSGDDAIVLGGQNSLASGRYSLVHGEQAKSFHDGAVVFADSTAAREKLSYGHDSFTIDFSGGCWITGGGFNARRGLNLYPTGDNPTSSTPGRSGDFAYKDDYLYVFTGDNADLSNKNWGRIQLSTLNNTPPSLVSNDSSIVHCKGNDYPLGETVAAVAFGGAATNPIITIPAGAGTYIIDCIVGAYKGSTTAASIECYLYNTDDNVEIPNTRISGTLAHSFPNPPTPSILLRTITGVNYGAAKNIRLYAKTLLDNDGAGVHATGTQISYIKLR